MKGLAWALDKPTCGVSTLEDIKRLAARKLHGAIVGRAYYNGDIRLAEAIEVAK